MPIDFDKTVQTYGLQIIAQIEKNFQVSKSRLMVEARYVYESLIAELEGTRMPIGVWEGIDDRLVLKSRETHERQAMIRRQHAISRYN